MTLALPVCLLLARRAARQPTATAGWLAAFLVALAGWHLGTGWLLGSWAYLHSTVGCNFRVQDLRPNIGLAWYLFVEMFDHFRAFFLAVFQLKHAVYVVPGLVKFRRDPVMLAAFYTAVASIFKPYPTVGDTVLMLTLGSFLGTSLLGRARVLPVYLFVLMFVSMLGPINLHCWIQQGSGNANFFYAVVLLFNAANILVAIDVVRQWVRRECERLNPGVSLDSAYQR